MQAVYHKLNDVLDTKLPLMFTLQPKAKLDLRLEPELSRATASDHYTAPAGDGSRPGVFWSVVNDPAKYGSPGMTTLFLHEGKRAITSTIALMQELNLPNFRKYGGNNAYTEGWALYAETLGKEMGLFGRSGAVFRPPERRAAARPRVWWWDTGMHAQGWTREQSIQYMHDTLGYDARGQERDRTLHGVAGTGAGLQDRLAENRRTAPARGRRAGRQVQTCRSSTRWCWATARCRWRCWRRRSTAGSPARSKAGKWRRPLGRRHHPLHLLGVTFDTGNHQLRQGRDLLGVIGERRSAGARRKPPCHPHKSGIPAKTSTS